MILQADLSRQHGNPFASMELQLNTRLHLTWRVFVNLFGALRRPKRCS